MKEQVMVKISKDGMVSVEINGVVGPRCKDITKALEDALHANVVSSNEKPEYYMELDGVKTTVTT